MKNETARQFDGKNSLKDVLVVQKTKHEHDEANPCFRALLGRDSPASLQRNFQQFMLALREKLRRDAPRTRPDRVHAVAVGQARRRRRNPPVDCLAAPRRPPTASYAVPAPARPSCAAANAAADLEREFSSAAPREMPVPWRLLAGACRHACASARVSGARAGQDVEGAARAAKRQERRGERRVGACLFSDWLVARASV